MKLRLLDDSVRLRLSRSEVIAVREHGVVESRTRFPNGSVFTFALESLAGDAESSASYARDRMVLKVPAAEIRAWASDDAAVSLRGELQLPDGGALKLLVEKDSSVYLPEATKTNRISS